jgi:hypothetical protein
VLKSSEEDGKYRKSHASHANVPLVLAVLRVRKEMAIKPHMRHVFYGEL